MDHRLDSAAFKIGGDYGDIRDGIALILASCPEPRRLLADSTCVKLRWMMRIRLLSRATTILQMAMVASSPMMPTTTMISTRVNPFCFLESFAVRIVYNSCAGMAVPMPSAKAGKPHNFQTASSTRETR
jgi:hypothetical protein